MAKNKQTKRQNQAPSDGHACATSPAICSRNADEALLIHEGLVLESPDRLFTSLFPGTHSNIIHKQLHLLGVSGSYNGPTSDSQRAVRLAVEAHHF